MQAFVNSVPDGSTISFPAGARYLLGGNGLILDGRNNLLFDGNGATLKSTGCAVSDSTFVIGQSRPSSGITIRNLDLIGDNNRAGTSSSYQVGCEYQMGVAVYQSRDIDISNVSMSLMNGDCVYIAERTSGGGTVWSDGITFHDSVCQGIGRMGVAVVGGKNVTVERVAFDRIAIHVFDIEPNVASGGARTLRFRDNSVGSFGHSSIYTGYFFAANGNGDAMVEDVVVSGNTVNNGTLKTLLEKPNRRSIVVRDNTSKVATRGPVMFFTGVSGVTVTGNRQPLSSGGLAKFTSCTNVTYDG